MRRADRLIATAIMLVACSAYAGEGHVQDSASAPTTTALDLPAPVGDLRDAVRVGLAAQADVATRTLATVVSKRDAAALARATRVRAAYRVLRPRTELGGQADQWLATARRRAATRRLLDGDRREVNLLADEAARLTVARARVAQDLASAVAMPAPAVSGLRWPVTGATIARDFGPFVHERSGATLSRHGVDLDVPDRAPVLAPGAGTVRYAGPIRGLDHGVVVDHGAYVTVIGKLADITVARGEKVVAGQALGHAARKRIYVEVRVPLGPGGTPVPPSTILR